MIRDQWYIVLESEEVGAKPAGMTRMGERLAFWRDSAGSLTCLHDQCVHRGVRLSRGKVLGDTLQCLFHGFEYDRTGRVTAIPANGRLTDVPKAFKVNSYPVHEAHGWVWIWWGADAPADLKPPRFFSDLGDPFSYTTARDPWDAHYSRVIENQLDVAHLPFVHWNTIGRGNRTVVDGPVVRWIDDSYFHVFVRNRTEDGTPSRKASEIRVDPERDLRLEFIFPNLWQNRISESVRVLAAFVPVDDGHTILYLRTYQKVVRAPLLRELFNRPAMPSNVYIAHQDRGVVQTQVPKATALRMQEQLIHADHPIIEYRRRREELKRGMEDLVGAGAIARKTPGRQRGTARTGAPVEARAETCIGPGGRTARKVQAETWTKSVIDR